MSGAAVLRASFVRTVGERDRIYVTRSDGSTASWAFPTYGDTLPHDLVHLVVESAFGLADGFWGRVDRGADPARITAAANRAVGPDKYAAFGPDRAELMRAEDLANVRWLADGEAPPEVAPERYAAVRAVLAALSRRWAALSPKGALDVAFDPRQPARGFDALLAEHPL